MKKDNLHYSPRKLDSYNKTWNFITSEREAGKTTAIPATKIYKAWRHHNRPSIVLRRHIVDITETYINDLQDSINDFLPDSQKIKFKYKKGTIKEGVVDVTVEDKPFCRFIALSNPKARIKSLRYDDPAYIIMDEFIVDNRNGEKYLSDEAGRFKELYNSFLRFATRHGHRLKCYFCGNPYSVYNPYYSWLDIDLSKIKPGAFLVGKDYVVECYQIKPELKQWIKKVNPLYEFDDAYARYAFDGISINDNNFPIVPKQPDGYKLKFVFRISHKYLGIYHKGTMRSDKIGYDCGKFWISIIDYVGENRKIIAVNFDNLVDNASLITTDIRAMTWRLKDAIASKDVGYSSIEAGYLTEAIYTMI